jgi:hypothetical protein
MSEIRIKTANPNVITNIPETLGNIKVKDINGDIRDVKKLYAKNSSGEPSLVWDTNVVVPPTTNISTQTTPEPPFCFECLPNSEVYYPLITKQGKRWNFCEWQKTTYASIEQTFQNTSNNPSEVFYIFDFQPDTLNFNPPPPNYIIFNYRADKPGVRFQLFVARESVTQDNILFYKPRSSTIASEICFQGCFPDPNQSTGFGVSINPCIQTISIDNNPFHVLYDSLTCECRQGSQPNPYDNSPNAPECKRECESYCYGIGRTGYLSRLVTNYIAFNDIFNYLSCSIVAPLRPIYAEYNNSETTDYLCPNYTSDPQNIDSTKFPLFAKTTDFFQTTPNPKFEYDSITQQIKTYLTLNDVRLTIDYCNNPEDVLINQRDAANPQIRLILPIYVNLPDHADKAIIFNQFINGSGDQIFYGNGGLLSNQPSPQNSARINPASPTYSKIIHEAYRIAKGEIKMSSLVLAKEDNKKYWGAMGYSKYSDANNSATHTHFLVINWAKCDCIDPNNSSCFASTKCTPMDDQPYNTCFTGNQSFPVGTFSFLPLKNKYTNDTCEPYKSYMDGQVLTAPTTHNGIQSIKQINEQLNSCTDSDDISIYGNPSFGVGKYYVDTGTSTTEPNGITFKKLYDAYYQPYITTTESTDCNTTCL